MKGKILRKSITGILALSMLCSSLYSTCSYAEEIPDLTDSEEIIADSTDISIKNTDEAESNQDMTFDTIEETEEIEGLEEEQDDTEVADEVESSLVYDTTNSLPANVEEEIAVYTQETVIVHEYAEGSPDDISDDDSTEDTSTDAWISDYQNNVINDTGLAADGTYGTVTLGLFNNRTYAGELLVYGVAKIDGKYYHVKLMESPGGVGTLGEPQNSSWHYKCPYVTSISFVKGSADGAYTTDMVKAGRECRGLFRGLPELLTVDLYGLDLSDTVNFGHFFCACSKLSYINFNTRVTKIQYAEHFFGSCRNLKFVNLSQMDFSNLIDGDTSYYKVLGDCYSLETILIPSNVPANKSIKLNLGDGQQYYYETQADKESAETTGNYDEYGYSELPQGNTSSIRISRNPSDEGQFAVSIDIEMVADPPTVYIGDTSQVTARVTWDNFSATEETSGKIVWEVSDDTIASLDEDGKVTGLRPGIVWITARSAADPSVSGRCSVTVMDDPVEENRRLFVHDNREGIEHTDMATGSVTKLNGNRFLMIEDLTDTDELALLDSLLSDEEYDILAAYDINLFYNQNGPDKDEDFGKCSMTIALPEDMDLSVGEVYPVSVKDGELEKISEYTVTESDDGVGFISISTTHFSPYALVYKEKEEEEAEEITDTPDTPDDTSDETVDTPNETQTPTSIVNIYPTITKVITITTENTIYKTVIQNECTTVIENESPPSSTEAILQSFTLSPVTGGYSGAPPGRPPDMFGIVVLLLLIGFMLGISDKVELPFDLLIEINALYEDIRAIRAGIYALNTIKTALQGEAIFEKRREIKKNCDFSDLWFAYPNFV